MSPAALTVVAIACALGAAALFTVSSDDDGSAGAREAIAPGVRGEEPRGGSDVELAIEAVEDDPLSEMVTERMLDRGPLRLLDRAVRMGAFVVDRLLAPLLLLVAAGAALLAIRRALIRS